MSFTGLLRAGFLIHTFLMYATDFLCLMLSAHPVRDQGIWMPTLRLV
jgi:hypothetical protein